MKLIIDIPDEMYQTFHNAPPKMGDTGMDSICQAIGNGTPLDGVLQEIRKEIQDAQRKAKINGLLWSSMSIALNIIDKHIKEIEE